MHIQQLTLTNVRQFEHGSFRFESGFNLLVGENGVGKTSLLRSLLAVLSKPQQADRSPALADQDIRLGSDGLRIEANIQGKNLGRRTLYYEKYFGRRARRPTRGPAPSVLFYGSNEAATRSFVARKIRRYSQEAPANATSEEDFLYDTERGMNADVRPDQRFGHSQRIRAFVVEALSRISGKLTNFHWRFEPYDCSIRSKDEAVPPTDSFKSIRRNLSAAIMRHLQTTQNPFRQIDNRTVSVDSNGYVIGWRASEPVTPKFRDLLKSVGGEATSLRYLESLTAEIRLTPRIVVQKLEGDFLLSQLSDGEQRLFSLFVDIARRLSLTDALYRIRGASAIVLIDEIDVHLHPKWQRMIVPALEDLFPACQFIATSHSPFVIQAVDRSKIQILGADSRSVLDRDATSIEDIAEDIQGVEMPQRGKRAEELSRAAERYFKLLRSSGTSPGALKDAEAAYRTATEPFSSNPALHALLKVEQMEAGIL